MSDSLRDQLLKAGFEAPKQEKKPARKKPRQRKPDAASSNAQKTVSKPKQTEPLAGHTHVPATKPKKQKAKKPPVIKPRAGSWSTRAPAADESSPDARDNSADNQQRQQMKAQVRQLIEDSEMKSFKGDVVYRFTLQNKIRELQVTEPVRKQLVAGELAITRLNGSTRLIPTAVVADIRAINAQWVIFLTTDGKDTSNDDEDEFPIPDDLIW